MRTERIEPQGPLVNLGDGLKFACHVAGGLLRGGSEKVWGLMGWLGGGGVLGHETEPETREEDGEAKIAGI